MTRREFRRRISAGARIGISRRSNLSFPRRPEPREQQIIRPDADVTPSPEVFTRGSLHPRKFAARDHPSLRRLCSSVMRWTRSILTSTWISRNSAVSFAATIWTTFEDNISFTHFYLSEYCTFECEICMENVIANFKGRLFHEIDLFRNQLFLNRSRY